GDCAGLPFTVVVSVNPRAEIGVLSTVICSGSTFEISPTVGFAGNIVPAGTLYSWSLPAYTGSFTGLATGSNAVSISGTVRNTWNSQQTLTYSVTTLSGDCAGLPFTVVVSVNPRAEITAISRVSCNGDLFVVSPTNNTNGIVPDGTLYSWNEPAITASISGGASGTDKLFISGTLFNQSNVTQRAYYSIVPVSGNCTGASFSLEVILNPRPVITQMTTVTCSGVFFNITPVDGTNGIVPIGTKYRWEEPQIVGGTIIGGESKSGQDGIFGYLVNRTNVVQTATYIVIPSIANCGDGAPFTVVVTLNPRAEIGVLSTVICSGSTFEISPTVGFAGNIVPAGTRYSWSLPAYTGSFTGLATGSNAVSISGTVRNT
ncbi:MAG: PKD-like domain-containing protein, partial [Bacteroidota bacterium]